MTRRRRAGKDEDWNVDGARLDSRGVATWLSSYAPSGRGTIPRAFGARKTKWNERLVMDATFRVVNDPAGRNRPIGAEWLCSMKANRAWKVFPRCPPKPTISASPDTESKAGSRWFQTAVAF